jgi:hypothetical protein
MGWIAHDAVLVATETWRPGGLPDIDAFRAEMPEEFRQLVIGPVKGAVNDTVFYVFLPDASKEGWDTSDTGDEWRDRFRALFTYQYEDGSSPDDVVSVRFGSVGTSLVIMRPRSHTCFRMTGCICGVRSSNGP